jgi:hypothetical protein
VNKFRCEIMVNYTMFKEVNKGYLHNLPKLSLIQLLSNKQKMSKIMKISKMSKENNYKRDKEMIRFYINVNLLNN